MPRRHIDDEPLALAFRYSLEGRCHLGMMPTPDECGPDLFDEGQKLVLRQFAHLQFLQFFEFSEQFLLLWH